MESRKPLKRVSPKPKPIDFRLSPRGWAEEPSTSVQATSPCDFPETTLKFDSPSHTPRYSRFPEAATLRDQLAALSEQLGSPREVAAAAASEVSTEPSEVPSLRWCAFCVRETVVCTRYKPTAKTFWSAAGIFLLGGVCGCFLLPWMTTGCQEPRLVCLRCKRFV